jgi:hypothetical protein
LLAIDGLIAYKFSRAPPARVPQGKRSIRPGAAPVERSNVIPIRSRRGLRDPGQRGRARLARPRPDPGAPPMSPPMTASAPGRNRDATFRASLISGVWSVTKNNIFYGDYLDRDQAISSACYGARAVEATGGQARVLLLPGDQLIAHRDHAVMP